MYLNATCKNEILVNRSEFTVNVAVSDLFLFYYSGWGATRLYELFCLFCSPKMC